MHLTFARHEKIWLRDQATFSEKWLHSVIADDPSILGLGEVDVIDRERIQDRSGRLDLLFSDGEATRYETEIMLGATDPSHIIRCIEYWDIERRRYPGYEHIAVLVAEDITSRFLNIMSLLSGTIPLIAIQLNALRVGDQLVLDFVHVLNQTSLRRDDESESEGEEVDRAYWEARVGREIMVIVDGILGFIDELAPTSFELRYLKGHCGISERGNWRNLVALMPKRQYVHVRVPVADPESWVQRIEEAGLPVTRRRQNRVQLTLTPDHFRKHHALLREVINDAMSQYQSAA